MLKVTLKKKFKNFLFDVSWETGDELVVLLGYSGSGKSLTINMIAGFVNPDEGEIVCNNRVFLDSYRGISLPPQKREVGYVSQYLSLFPHMTVRKNIEYGVRTKDKKDMVEKIIIKMGLKGYEDLYPDQLSGGQRQRVALGRALVSEPAILLLDEPFSMLDFSVREEMQNLVLNLKKELSVPVVLVTHDITEAFMMSEKIIIYSGGMVKSTLSLKEIERERNEKNFELLRNMTKRAQLLINGGTL